MYHVISIPKVSEYRGNVTLNGKIPELWNIHIWHDSITKGYMKYNGILDGMVIFAKYKNKPTTTKEVFDISNLDEYGYQVALVLKYNRNFYPKLTANYTPVYFGEL